MQEFLADKFCIIIHLVGKGQIRTIMTYYRVGGDTFKLREKCIYASYTFLHSMRIMIHKCCEN